jgi:hypothetical protein
MKDEGLVNVEFYWVWKSMSVEVGRTSGAFRQGVGLP